MSNLNPHPSLPARPPQSSHPTPRPAPNPSQRAFPAFGGMMPRSVASRAPVAATQLPPMPTHAPMMTQQPQFNPGGYQSDPYRSSTAYYQQQQPGYGTTTPFNTSAYGLPGATARGVGKANGYDPEEEARIQEWNQAYQPRDDAKKAGQAAGAGGNANTIALGSRPADVVTSPTPDAGTGAAGAAKGKEKTVIRQAGGKTWDDATLLEWDPLHPRLFVGNLAGEVTDDSLMKAFSKYPSLSNARVIRDKKSTKSKSYGFVSFSNTDDYFRAAKEMEGKYIGSHPVRIKRAKTEIVATTKKDDKRGKKKHDKNKKATGAGSGVVADAVLTGAATYNSNAGIAKFSHKNKSGGPRILG